MGNLIIKEHLQEFQAYLHREERCPGTVDKYLRDVRAFSEWLKGREVTKENAAEWKGYLVSVGYAPVTINSMLSALNTFLGFWGWNECRVKFLRVQRKVFRDQNRELTRNEYARLLETARARGKDRLELLMETICATGICVSEVQYITVEAASSGRAEISMKGKVRVILLSQKLCRKLLKYAKKKKSLLVRYFSLKAERACPDDRYGVR